MKQAELLKLGDQVWIRKRKGFRIQCQEFREEDGRMPVTMPSETEPALESDVAAWRVAIKLSESAAVASDGNPVFTDITVVDDTGEKIKYYVTDSLQIYNPSAG